MFSPFLPPDALAARTKEADLELYHAGHAAGVLARVMEKAGGDAVVSYGLKGRLYRSKSGWGLLQVPNAVGNGLFDALQEVGVEQPKNSAGVYNAHVSVFRPEELEQIGGADRVTEWGHVFGWTLGPVREVTPDGWAEMSRVWFAEVKSPDLEKLRKSYGLSALPNADKYPFHLTFAVRRKRVTTPESGVTKLGEADRVLERVREEADLMSGIRVLYHPGPPAKVFVDVMDWGSDKAGKLIGEALGRVVGKDNVAYGNESGPPGEGWEKVAEAAADQGPPGEHCPHCDARLERDPDAGTCNRCGKAWPEKRAGRGAATERLLALAKRADGPLLRAPAGVDPQVSLFNEAGFAGSFAPGGGGASLTGKLFSLFGEAGRAAYKHVPRVRLVDSVAGGLLGAGAGAAVQAVRNQFRDDADIKRRGRGYGAATLLGAAAGVAGGNVVGDRARRYLSNTLVPMGYEGNGEESPTPWERVRPKSWRQFYDAAIRDVPAHQPVEGEWAWSPFYKNMTPEQVRADYAKRVAETPTLRARTELVRRELGVHTDDAARDAWVRNPDGSLSVNPQAPDAKGLLELLTGSPDHAAGMAADPITYARDANTGAGSGHTNSGSSGLMGGLVGGQRAQLIPLPGRGLTKDDGGHLLRVLDRWDYTLDPKERAFVGRYLPKLLTDRKALDAPVPPEMTDDYTAGHQRSGDLLKTLLARDVMDRVLVHEQPWIHQYLRFDPQGPKQPYKVTPLTGEGRAYPVPAGRP